MPTYVSLFKTTTKGKENIAQLNDRREQGLQLVESFGGEVKGLYYGVGPYDMVFISEFPDLASGAKVKVAYEQMGLAEMETFEVFNPEEWDTIVTDATSAP